MVRYLNGDEYEKQVNNDRRALTSNAALQTPIVGTHMNLLAH